MARYIDADWIYQMVENRYRVSSGIEHRCERDLLDLICEAPDADVAPRAEVAREIFEEIEKYNRKPLPECEPVYIIKASEFAELKKKYTQPDPPKGG